MKTATIVLYPHRYAVWFAAVSFLLFQFFLQLSSGMIIGSIRVENHLSAAASGLLSSAFYYIYTLLQVPVGILFDRFNTRRLLTATILICGLGCFIFSHSYHLTGFIMGRLIIGGSSAFAFVGLSHVLRQFFPSRQFALMIGLSETLGFIITILAITGMASLINWISWRFFINIAALISVIMAFICWLIIPNTTITHKTVSNLNSIIKNIGIWLNGLYAGISFSTITVFGALWAIPFIELKLNCSFTKASLMDSIIFLGAAVSCPLFGFLNYWFNHRILMISSALITASLMMVILYLPLTVMPLSLLLFFTGLSCGAYMLSFSVIHYLTPQTYLSTATGFTNALTMLVTLILQPLVGLLLDHYHTNHYFSLNNYQQALIILPLLLFISALIAVLLPQKNN